MITFSPYRYQKYYFPKFPRKFAEFMAIVSLKYVSPWVALYLFDTRFKKESTEAVLGGSMEM